MIVSPRSFRIELYEEYLEEASFLYEQRLGLYGNPEIGWRQIGRFEDRLEAHIDGLAAGGDLALDVCKRKAREGDFGEIHAAVRVFCRHERRDLLLQAFDDLDIDDSKKVHAVADALKYELPESWQPVISRLLEDNSALALIGVEVTGYRRFRTSDALIKVLERSPASELLARTVWALGRIRAESAWGSLYSLLLDAAQPIRSAAAIALLRIGDQQSLHYCMRRVNTDPWAILPVALAGSRDALAQLLRQAGEGNGSTECLIGLGIMGYSAAIPVLIRYLDTDQATAAANSLDRIAGAGLIEEVFIADDVDENELFEEERKKFTDGRVPSRADGKPFGSTTTRVSQSSQDWHRWWHRQEASLDAFKRYRNGVEHSPICLVQDLERNITAAHCYRSWTYEELAIQYGFDVPFEADMPVAQQVNALTVAAEWAHKPERHS